MTRRPNGTALAAGAEPAAVLAVARAWLAKGRAVIPIPHGHKAPVIRDWPSLRMTEDTAAQYFSGAAQNIGVLLGEPSGGLVDVDLDTDEAVRAVSHFLPVTFAYGRERRPSSHRLYVCTDATTKKWRHGGTTLLELRSTGCQSVIPPSTHPDGDRYIRSDFAEPAAQIEHGVLLEALGRTAAAALLAQHWSGARHDMTLALAGALLHSGWAPADVETFVEAVAAAARDEELGDRLRAVRDTAADRDAGKPITGWPTLAEMLPDDVVGRAREWLGVEDFPALEAAPKRPDDDGLMLVRASDVPPRKLEPLWPGVLWLGKPTLAVGDPDRGKSLLLLDIAARVTTGAPWPCSDQRQEAGDVLIASAEDDPDDTIVPRLIAAGADLARVHFVRGVRMAGKTAAFALDRHWPQFAEAVRRIRPRLIELDPLSAFLGRTDSNNEGETRVLLAGLAEIARESRAAVLALRHFRKGGSETPHGRVIGSIAFTAAARAVYAVLADPDDEQRRLLIKVKCNLTQDTPGYRYRIVSAATGDPRLEWDEEFDYRTAEELLVDGNTTEKQRECEECGELFVGRRDAKYCSNACKQVAKRGRKRATPLVEQGRSVSSRVGDPDRPLSTLVQERGRTAEQAPLEPSRYEHPCTNCRGKGCHICDDQLRRP